MTAAEILPVAGFVLVAIGLIATWARNGRSQAKYMGAMETRFTEQIKTVFSILNNEHTGLGAIKESVDDQKEKCAGVTSGFEERIKSLEGGRRKT